MGDITLIICSVCGRGYPDGEMLTFIDENGRKMTICEKCWKRGVL